MIKREIKNMNASFSNIIKSDTNQLITVGTNIKEMKKLASSLNVNLKELRRLELEYKNGNQELKSSMTNISHDMRTPLTAISGYIELIKETDDALKKQEYLKVIERKTEELIALTENVFDFAKTVDRGETIEKEPCLLNELLEETLANYYSIFREKGIVPEIRICEQKVYRNVNKNSMIRVFENILSNVEKYSNGNFKVKLETTGKIVFSNEATSLDGATVQKIFNRYFTVESIPKLNGLGLAIAKQLVELNGGSIKAEYRKENLVIDIQL